MKINRNILAVSTNRQLLRTESKLSASMERLSSGYKINKAGDNPAGIAISSKMRAQIAGLDQAESNASDAVSVLNIADGALGEISNILQRMRELAVQAGNDTNTYDDRKSIQQEIDELTKEVDRISTDTEYNTKTLLDGSCNTRSYSKQVERLYVSDSVLPGDYELEVDSAAAKAECTFSIPADAPAGTIEINGISMDYSEAVAADEDAFFESLRDTAEQAGCTAERAYDNTDPANPVFQGYKISSAEYGSDESFSLEFSSELGQKVNLVTADAKLKEYTHEGVIDQDQPGITVMTFYPNFDENDEITSDGTITINGEEVTYTQGTTRADFDTLVKSLETTAGITVTEENGLYTIKPADGETALNAQIEGDYVDTLTSETEDIYEKTYRVTMLDPNDNTKELGDPQGKDAKVSLTKVTQGVGFSETATASADGKRIKITDISGFSIDFMLKDDANVDSTPVKIEVTDIGAMTIQLGANQYQEMDVCIPEISSESLYLDTVDVTVTNGPDKALITLDDAISKLGDVRSKIGAYSNRLESATSSLSETQLDLTSALSTLTDTDMAQEITEYTQWNVLEQASMSVLSQANDIPEQVLSLLR